MASVWVGDARMGGLPCLRGTRVPVHIVLATLAGGMNVVDLATECRIPVSHVRGFLRELAARFQGVPTAIIDPTEW